MKFLYGRDLISKTARTLNQVQLQNLDMFSLTLTLALSLSLHLPLSHFPHLVEGILKVETFPEKKGRHERENYRSWKIQHFVNAEY